MPVPLVSPDGILLKRRRGRPPKSGYAAAPPVNIFNDINAPEVQSRIRSLIRLAKDQDHLNWDDINEALPSGIVTVDLIDEVISRLRSLEIRITDERLPTAFPHRSHRAETGCSCGRSCLCHH